MRDRHCPECRWVPVVDGSGRRRLELRWEVPPRALDTATRAA